MSMSDGTHWSTHVIVSVRGQRRNRVVLWQNSPGLALVSKMGL